MRSTGPAVPRGSRRQGIPASSRPRSRPRFPASTSAVPAPWSNRTSVSQTTSRLSGSPRPSPGSGTVGSSSPRGRRRGSRRRAAQLLGFIESDDPRAGTHPRMTAEPSPLDRLENEARGSRIAQAQVRPERGEEVGVDRRRHRSPKRKRPPGGGLGQNRWVLWPSARSRIAHGATRPRCERRSSPRAYPRSVPRERRPAGLVSWSQVSYCDSRPE